MPRYSLHSQFDSVKHFDRINQGRDPIIFNVDEKDKPTVDDRWLKDLPVQSENLGYAAEEMLKCGKCGRANPPNRLKCLYCAAELAIRAEDLGLAKPTLRRLESWEKGFNVVAIGPQRSEVRVNVPAVAKDLGLEREAVAKILSVGSAMPVARVESEKEAELICLRLKNHGIESTIVSDDALDPDKIPRRLRGLEFEGGAIVAIDFNTKEKIVIPVSGLLLIVTGTLFEMKTASLEKRKKGKSRLLDQSETSSDEPVLDLYSREDPAGFRIYESGFDFSCLGSDKSLLAADNMPKLVRKLSDTCPNAKLVERYSTLQDALGVVWEVESRKDFEGLRRSGFGKADFGNVLTVSNLTQFNRYSRLQRQLL